MSPSISAKTSKMYLMSCEVMWIKFTTLTEQAFNTIDDILIFLIGLIDFEVVPLYLTRLLTILTRFVLVENAPSDAVSF